MKISGCRRRIIPSKGTYQLSFIIIALALQFILIGQTFGEIIPSDRRIDWKPGILGGIPNYPVDINVKDAPYNAVGDGVTDDTTAIANAISACSTGRAVYLPEGTYKISETIKINKSIALRGAGMNKTRIVMNTSSAKVVVKIGGSPYLQKRIALSSGYTKGSKQLTFENASVISGISVGDMIAVYQLNDTTIVDPRGTIWGGLYHSSGPMAFQIQLVKVTGKNDNKLKIHRPLYWTLQSNLSPEIRHYTQIVKNAGLEDLTIETANYYSADSVQIIGTIDSWVKNVKVYRSAKSFIWMTMCLNVEVRGCYVHDPWNNEGGSGYGYHLFGPNSDVLIEDNIALNCRHSFVLEGGISGCVLGYNYSRDPHSASSPYWVYNDLITHGLHPFMNLYEGNIIHKWSEDYVHGSASHNTGFRNYIRIVGDSSYFYKYGLWAVSHEPWNYYSNVLGSVLGWPGITNYPNTSYESNDKCIYKLGYSGEGGTTVTDTLVKQRLLRHGNFDFVTRTTLWNSEIADRTLPKSLYLLEKPAFFGDLPWPCIGPDLSPMVSPIPAELRFKALSPPRNLRIVY